MKNPSKTTNNEENNEQAKRKSQQQDAIVSNFGENLNINQHQDKPKSPALSQHNKILPNGTSVHTNGHEQPKVSTNIDADGYDIPIGDPEEWDCNQVYSFVKQIAGSPVATTFKMQEVDGSALALIKDDHLVNTMQLKLGPALKILHKFNEIRAKFK